MEQLNAETITHYDENAHAFWKGTKDHDVSQNIDALLRHIESAPPLDILDLGCGPGRDLLAFKALGHRVVGLDGSAAFVKMATARANPDAPRRVDVEVWHQDFLKLALPPSRFDGLFANASLFHVATQELPRVLRDLHGTLKPSGVLFSSNPRGPDVEGMQGDRYGAYLTLPTWRAYLTEAGFEELEYYFRPAGKPLAEQRWLATVWRKLG
ncbi:MAG: class I SAM-dependent methyltransferase [Myxococcales bacterium]|nr:class I SAM-dependent methyltransferase [Myxococcales bacterium]